MNENMKKMLELVEKEHIERLSYNQNSKILILDGLNNYIRNWVTSVEMNADGKHVGGITGFLKSLGLAIRMLEPTRVIIIFDGNGGSKRRRKIYPEYKATRGHGVKLNRKYNWSSDSEEDEQKIAQLKRLVAYLKLLPITIMIYDNIEADDAIGEVVKLCEDKSKIYIMSTDKDFYQLITDNVNIWHPIHKKMLDKKWIMEKYGVDTKNVLIQKALIGDTGDNIPGIDGFGIKTINKHFPILAEDRKISIEEFKEYVKELSNTKKPPKVILTLLEQWDKFLLNIRLMTLSEANVSYGTKVSIEETLNTKTKRCSESKLNDLFLLDKINSMNGYDYFKNNFVFINTFCN
jgi:5'-3' exonuclease